MKRKEQVLVTGGAGFLGSHLCKHLLQQNKHVICIDNYLTGNKTNIESLLSYPYFECIRHDITEPLHIEVDKIYNLACPASPIHYQNDPVKTIKTCVLGTINMLELATKLNIKVNTCQIDAKFFIVDRKEILFYLSKDPKNDDTAIWLNSEFFAEAFAVMFDKAVL